MKIKCPCCNKEIEINIKITESGKCELTTSFICSNISDLGYDFGEKGGENENETRNS